MAYPRSNGQIVAVNVQRPGVQMAISLDIFILHFLAGLVRRAGKLNTDLQVGYCLIHCQELVISFGSIFLQYPLTLEACLKYPPS